MRLHTSLLSRLLFPLVLSGATVGCAAVFPELSTRFSEAPDLGTFDPPPPPDRYRLRVVSGKVPAKTRDGREWDKAFGSLPDPYATVFVNEKQLFRTNAQTDTLEPTWPDSPKGNFLFAVGDKVEVQLWDSSAFNDSPIGQLERTITLDNIDAGEVRFDMNGGGEVVLEIKPAEAVWGAGFWFELRNDSVHVTRLIEGSPASRAELKPGDEIVSIDGKPLSAMTLAERRSLLAAFPAKGYQLSLKRRDGSTLEVPLKEGPIYALHADYKRLPVVPR